MFLLAKRHLSEALKLGSPALFRFLKSCLHLGTGRQWKEDFFDRWTGRRDALTPPLRQLFDGTTDYRQFQKLGDALVKNLVRHGLQPHQRVLEVGSGNGKNARALTKYLNRQGRYEGFDVVPSGVAWCQQEIASRFPNFRFHRADIHNRTYNPAGKTPAHRFRFPYADETFDYVFLASVFTHMLPADLGNYVAEIARVLKPGGRCFASFFLLNAEALRGMAANRGGRTFPFPTDLPGCRVADRTWPEDAVAYDEGFLRRQFYCNGLAISEPIAYGAWWKEERNAQDGVWLTKTSRRRTETVLTGAGRATGGTPTQLSARNARGRLSAAGSSRPPH